MVPSASDDYFNISALSDIKKLSQKDSKAALQQVASQFETIFMKMMLKSMRDASFGNPLFDSDSAKFYRDMHDDQLALKLSNAGGVGIANMLVKQLEQYLPATNDKLHAPEEITPKSIEKQAENKPIQSPKEFVERLWPEAERAANKLGVSPKVLLAQAALETGWGKFVIQAPDGKNSHNLFNIKADQRWKGEKATISTVEYVGGVAQRQQADFRVYDSFSHSFEDYVNFLQENPRYKKALNLAHDSGAYLKSLQEAGYATDPKYAEKIQRILKELPANDALVSTKPANGSLG